MVPFPQHCSGFDLLIFFPPRSPSLAPPESAGHTQGDGIASCWAQRERVGTWVHPCSSKPAWNLENCRWVLSAKWDLSFKMKPLDVAAVFFQILPVSVWCCGEGGDQRQLRAPVFLLQPYGFQRSDWLPQIPQQVPLSAESVPTFKMK